MTPDSKSRYPLVYAIKYPNRISVEHGGMMLSTDVSLHFMAIDGDRLTVILSQEQVMALVSGNFVRDPEGLARDLYVKGNIEVEEFEQRIGKLMNRNGTI